MPRPTSKGFRRSKRKNEKIKNERQTINSLPFILVKKVLYSYFMIVTIKLYENI